MTFEMFEKGNQERNFLSMHVKFIAGISISQELKMISDGSQSAE